MIRIPQKREASIENSFLQRLSRHAPNWRCVKLNLTGNRGWPDRLCLGPYGLYVFIEFKRPEDGELSAVQEERVKWLRANEHPVFVFETATEAFGTLYRLEEAEKERRAHRVDDKLAERFKGVVIRRKT